MTEHDDASTWTIQAIGTVSSGRTEAIDDDWGGVEATIVLLDPYRLRCTPRARRVQPHRGHLPLRSGRSRHREHRQPSAA